MNDLLRPHLHKFIHVFFDNILVYSQTFEQHIRHLQLALQLLKDNRFNAKTSNCFIGQIHISFLGHVISKKGVGVDQDKVQAVLEWPVPINAKELCGFPGLTGLLMQICEDI